MGLSRRTIPLLLVVAAACDVPAARSVTPNKDAPTPVPVLLAPFKLAFAPPFAVGVTLAPSLSVTPRLVMVSEQGDTLQPGARLSFISRKQDVATVDSGGTITAHAMGATWIVASIASVGISDSIEVTVRCTAELWIDFEPPTATLRVGESFIPRLALWTCGRLVKIEDSFWWRSYHPTDVVRVDSATGRTTALAPGRAWLVAMGGRGNGYAALPVTVIQP